MTNYLVLLRHGQSEWNKQNIFTGFHDVDITKEGEEEALQAGTKLKEAGIKFDQVFTSTLIRAFHTTELALSNMEELSNHLKNKDGSWKLTKHDDLRERDYGDLTGLNKAETAEKFGKEQVHIWRRSYDVKPPGGECLKDVVENRVKPYYNEKIKPLINKGQNILIGAHGNSLRAMLIILGVNTPDNINSAEMPTGVPRVFEIEDGKIIKDYFLEDKKI